ncbi:MAG: cold shock domain-containing protein [Bacteroidota bacterium]|nr:cold shock domain-containing protein [Bacteroidota bacterium]
MQGIIIKITDKGFGFISIEGQPKDVFFGSKSLIDVTFAELREGDMVSFETEETPRGLNAINVRRIYDGG